MITNINEYKKKMNDVEDKNIESGIDQLNTVFNSDTFEPIDMDLYEIDKVIAIITDVEEISKLENKMKSTSLNYKYVGKNDIIWLTVMLKPRNKSTAFNLGELGVVQCKVLRTYYGLNKLKQLKAKDKIINF